MFPPFLFKLITLITYLFSRTLVSSCPWLGLAHHSLHLTLPWCWLINIRDSVFSIFFVLCTNHFFGLSVRQKIWFLRFPPLGLVSHFSLFYLQLPFNSSRLHFSQLASPAWFCLLVWPLFFCGRTGESDWRESVRFCPPQSLSTVPERREHARSAYPRQYSQ